ncbi:MAG: hypothetical protein PHS53_02985 [Candidatus Pacebacteria bacterium]|nr:hypothetical protein [Candidatus Paceibacterota bacterium]MDD5357085.1 hypothetical protein [Candidatus Paceibacterota bacterium]
MKKIHAEIALSALFVVLGTLFAYTRLVGFNIFWNSQVVWSIVLAIGWVIVAIGYYNQGWIVHKAKSADHVSVVLPIAVFIVQCVLFVKGIYYHDWSLIAGAVMVNSGVVFSLYQILKVR